MEGNERAWTNPEIPGGAAAPSGFPPQAQPAVPQQPAAQPAASAPPAAWPQQLQQTQPAPPAGWPQQPAPQAGWTAAPVPPSGHYASGQPAAGYGAPQPPVAAAPAPVPDYGRIGGALLAFIILQAVHSFFMLSGFPNVLEDAFTGILQPPYGVTRAGSAVYTAATVVSLVTLVGYAVFIIMALVQLITRNSAFLRSFQVAGIVAVAGNLAAFVLKEFLKISGLYEGYLWGVDYYWMLVVLALLWTIFWTLYFVRSVRMRAFMSPSNPYTLEQGVPYIEKALFGRGMKG